MYLAIPPMDTTEPSVTFQTITSTQSFSRTDVQDRQRCQTNQIPIALGEKDFMTVVKITPLPNLHSDTVWFLPYPLTSLFQFVDPRSS